MKKVIEVNSLANFEFWKGMYQPRTEKWKKEHLKELQKGFKPYGTTDEERQDKIKALKFVMKNKFC